MVDKRTTPDPAEGARRRKGPAPTIDLTATEVSAKSAADEPHSPPEQDAHEQPEVVHDSEPANGRDGSSRKRGTAWQVLFAGFAGAVIVAAMLSTLWLAGLVPARYDGSIRADPASIAALNDRMAKLEATAKTSSDPTVFERLSAADNAMKSLGVAMTALTKRSDEVAATAADARLRADASEKAMTELRNRVQDLGKNASAGPSPADVDSVKKRIAALEQLVKGAPADSAARLALSAVALRDAVVSGAPFITELEEAKSLGADEKILTPLAPFAASGMFGLVERLRRDARAVPAPVRRRQASRTEYNGFLACVGGSSGPPTSVPHPNEENLLPEASVAILRKPVTPLQASISGGDVSCRV